MLQKLNGEAEKYIYRYDGGIEGFFTAVFDIYDLRRRPYTITASAEVQPAFDTVVIDVITDPKKAARVEKGIIKNIGRLGFAGVLRVFSASFAYKDDSIYEFLQVVFAHGQKAGSMLSDPRVIKYNEIMQNVNYECHRFKGFVRFREIKGGIMYAPIRPDHDILEFIMPHFCERFHIQKFAIFDVGRKKLGAFDGREWRAGYLEDLPEIELTETEADMQRVWKMYYDTVTIKERASEKRRRAFLPDRYREFMPEINNDIK